MWRVSVKAGQSELNGVTVIVVCEYAALDATLHASFFFGARIWLGTPCTVSEEEEEEEEHANKERNEFMQGVLSTRASVM